MEFHALQNSKSHQLLDLTHSKEIAKPKCDVSESLVLDLSRKNMSTASTIMTSIFCNSLLNKNRDSLTSTFFISQDDAGKQKQKQSNNFTDMSKNGQFQTAIVTQGEPPKKRTTIQIYNDRISDNQMNSREISDDRMNDNQMNDYINKSLVLAHLASNQYTVPMIEPALPHLMTNGGAIPKIPTAASPATASLAVGSLTNVAPLEARLPTSSLETTKKITRPFKAYPRDPLALAMNNEQYCDYNSNLAYVEFRNKMLNNVRKVNEGTNSKMRRMPNRPGSPTSTVEEKDAAYWERRKKNNEAAKRSRDARRAKEDEIAIRAAFLEQENRRLKSLIQKIIKEVEFNTHLNIPIIHEIRKNFSFDL